MNNVCATRTKKIPLVAALQGPAGLITNWSNFDMKHEQKLDHKALLSRLVYFESSGEFIYKDGFRAGRVAGTTDKGGYRMVGAFGSKYLAHRLAWFYVNGEWPVSEIDHIDGVKTNNAISNLRAANRSQNKQNTKVARADNKTGTLGATAFVSNGKTYYQARINIGGSAQYLGCFKSAEDAHKAYIAAKREFHEFCTI